MVETYGINRVDGFGLTFITFFFKLDFCLFAGKLCGQINF